MKVQLLVRQNQTLGVPWLPVMEKACTVTLIQKKFIYDPDDPRQVSITHVKLFTPLGAKPEEGGIFYTGQLERVQRMLAKEGHELDVRDMRTRPSGDVPALPEGMSYRTNQPEVIHAVLNNPNGIIQAPPSFGKSFCIAQLCRSMLGLQVLVVTQRKEVLKQLYTNIRATAPLRNVSLCNAGKDFNEVSDVVVCSAKSLHKVPTDWPQVLLFDEVHGAASTVISRILGAFTNTRMYGFSATPTGRGDNGDRLVEAMFGPVIYRINYEKALESKNVTRTQVRMVPVTGGECDYSNFTALNRYGYWRNTQRNKKIADVVDALHKEGIDRILVLVNTAEHAFCLRMFLPGFEVVHAGLSAVKFEEFKKEGLLTNSDLPTVPVDDIVRDFKTGKIKGVVSTPKLREGVDFVELQAVIRADGLTGSIASIQIGGRAGRIFEGKDIAVVVDFEDHFGQEMLGRSLKRIANYKQEGWQVVTWNV